jgi:hypothetical protein
VLDGNQLRSLHPDHENTKKDGEMSYLLFMDESGHDHRQTPYEVRGGFCLHVGKLWPFVRSMKKLERDAFGVELTLYKSELKGAKLLKRKRFKAASQEPLMHDEERRKLVRSLLTKGLEKKAPVAKEICAYGQACLLAVDGLFQLLDDHEAVVFASAIPRGALKEHPGSQDLLRKDHVFLLERFYYHLEAKQEHGLLVFDEVEKTEDRRFVRRIERYYTSTTTGRFRSKWIVPTPFFVSSEMTYAVQAADIVIYCINWGFRIARFGMDAPTRLEIAERYGSWLGRLQFRSDGYRDGASYESFGIAYVSDPNLPRGQKKEGNAFGTTSREVVPKPSLQPNPLSDSQDFQEKSP